MGADRALRCERCDKPVLLMTDEQVARVQAHPEHYRFVCLECSGDTRWRDYGDAGG